jgi:hypothetical protein
MRESFLMQNFAAFSSIQTPIVAALQKIRLCAKVSLRGSFVFHMNFA